MVGFIFGIIVVLAGIIAAVVFTRVKQTSYAEDAFGRYVRDDNGNRVENVSYPLKKFSALVLIAGFVLGLLFTGFGCITSVDTGYTGIVRTFGKVEDFTYDAGMHIKAPWQSVVQIDNRVQKATMTTPCFSSDIQEVNTVYTVNYQISKTNAQDLYRSIGVNYLETVVNPAIQESVKTIMARYTAENLIGEREKLADEIETHLSAQLEKYHIEVVSSAIEDMDFTDSFTAAVEAKQVAAQKKLQAEIEQAQELAKAENDKKIAELNANAKAEVDKVNATAQAEIAQIQAEADKIVAQINADSAEYQGKKEAAIALQRLASINGWTVVTETSIVIDGEGNETTAELHVLYKSNGEKVTDAEMLEGAKRLIEYYYTQTWDGKLPETVVGEGDVSSIIIGNSGN